MSPDNDAEVEPTSADVRTSCPWTYQLECDDDRWPSVLIVARCLSVSDQCEPVYTEITVKRRNSTTGQLDEVNESFAVACRPRRTPDDPYNFDDYTDTT